MSFGISNSVKSRIVRVCTPENLDAAIDSPEVGRVCAEIADARESTLRGEMSRGDFETLKAERKKRLPVITPHATFPGGRRLGTDAVPSGLSMYDVDHISDPRGYYAAHVAGREAELGVVLAHVTPSTEGLRLLFAVPEAGMSLEAAQRWMSGRLGDEAYDGAVKDWARCSFLVPRDYILYIDEAGLFRERAVTPPDDSGGNPPESAEGKASPDPSPTDDKARGEERAELMFKGIPYAAIIREWLRATGGDPVKGERNTRLHRLASHLRYICDNNEALIVKVIPRYGLPEEEVRGLVHSACAAKFCSTPREMLEAVRRAGGEESPVADEQPSGPPAIPRKLPKLIKLLVSRTPEVYQPAVAHAVFPSLAAHLHQVRFRYIDNVAHEATLMNVLMAGTGAGKDCISEPINHIMADIRRRDEENLRREREWKNEVNSKGANKDKRTRPEGLIIQEIDADMTNPAFVMRTAEADGHFLYTKMNEIDQFDALRGGGRGQQQFQIMCLAFDPGNRYGQTRVGTQSVTEKVTIRFNWNAATTVQKGKRYFARTLTDGPISRINFCTIPEREIGADMPVYGTYDAAFDEELRPYVENLTRAAGEVDCPEAYRLAKRLKEECADFARLSQSRVYENLSFRANVIAYLKACVLYVANGGVWDKTIEEFTRWSLRYDLWCKMEFFARAIEEANKADAAGEHSQPGRRNLLESLPDEFGEADALRVRQEEGLDAKGLVAMLRVWKNRGYIEEVISIISNNNYDLKLTPPEAKREEKRYRKLKYKTSWK